MNTFKVRIRYIPGVNFVEVNPSTKAKMQCLHCDWSTDLPEGQWTIVNKVFRDVMTYKDTEYAQHKLEMDPFEVIFE